MEKKTNVNSVKPAVSLTLGIISILSAFFWYITLPTGIIGLIFGVKSYRAFKSKLGLAGTITSIVGLSLFAFIYITLIIILILNSY